MENKEVVIFDTNGYRNLVKYKTPFQVNKIIQRLNILEKKNNIVSLMSSIVLRELLSHVADKKDPFFNDCLKATKAIYDHCGNNETFRMIADFDLQISRSFFNQTIVKNENTELTLGQIAYLISKNPETKVLKRLQPQLRAIKEYVHTNELNFANEIKNFILSIDPNSSGWQIYRDDSTKRADALKYINSDQFSREVGLAYLLLTHDTLVNEGLIASFSEQEIKNRLEEFIQVFKAPIELYKEVLRRSIHSEFNMLEDSRANFLWDIHLMFCVGDHSIQNSKVYFITGDKAYAFGHLHLKIQ